MVAICRKAGLVGFSHLYRKNWKNFRFHIHAYTLVKSALKKSPLMSFSKANNSLSSRTAAVGNMGAAIVAHMARSICSRIAAVICNWKGLYFSGQKPSTQVESNRWDSDTKLVFFFSTFRYHLESSLFFGFLQWFLLKNVKLSDNHQWKLKSR